MSTTQKVQCEQCGKWIFEDEAIEWSAPAQKPIRVCDACADELEAEL